MAFRGSFDLRVDEKSRVVIPQKFRYELGERFIIVKGLDGCLFVFTEKDWKRDFEDRIEGQPLIDPALLKVERFFLGELLEGTTDNQNRVTLPARLRDHAGIELQSDVVIVGMTNRLEIWSRERWETFNSELTEDVLVQSAVDIGIGRKVI